MRAFFSYFFRRHCAHPSEGTDFAQQQQQNKKRVLLTEQASKVEISRK